MRIKVVAAVDGNEYVDSSEHGAWDTINTPSANHHHHHHHHSHYHHHHYHQHPPPPHHHHEGRWPELIKSSAKAIQLANGDMTRREDGLLTPSPSGHALTMPHLAARAENSAQPGWIPPWLARGWGLCWTIAPEDWLPISLPSLSL